MTIKQLRSTGGGAGPGAGIPEASARRILVIDDNRSIHDDFRKILAVEDGGSTLDAMEADLFGTPAPGVAARARRQTYVVDSAYQGEQGLEMVQRAVEEERPYPLAFVDMRMPPGWDGLKTIEMLWNVDPDIQIVVCTAYSDHPWEDIFAKFGSGDRLLILKKPFDTVEVCQLACALTEKWHLARRAHLKLSQLRGMVDEQTAELEAANRRLRAEIEQRQRTEDRYSLAALGANDGLWDWDLERGTIYYSSRWKEMLGHTDAEIGDAPSEWLDRVHPDDTHRLQASLQAHLARQSDHLHCELRIRHRDGQYRWVLCRGIAIHSDGRATRAAGSLTNITDRKMAEEQLRFEALHDALTGLANRTLLAERLTHCLARGQRDPSYKFALLYIDLDHFKVINDSLGHVVGDKLLVEIARRLSGCARKVDTIAHIPADHVARIGGDEFVMLLEDLSDPVDAMRVAERIHVALAGSVNLDGHDLQTSGSIGIAVSDPRYQRAEEVMRDADTALYQAKEAGKACTRMFDPRMHEWAMARWSTETELRRAIDRNEFIICYQPIYEPVHPELGSDGRLAALEALVRWQHPTRGLVPPDEFIPIAEETGLIVPLGRLIMQASCRQLRRWQEQFPSASSLSVGVNVSNKQFASPAIADDIAAILRDAGLRPEHLRIEITETTAMRNAAQTIDTLTRLRAMGIHIYMDDFGTGYSSLSQLHRMPIDALKIDRAFVATMDRDPISRSIVEAVIALGHSMGLRVIAEGVETRQHRDSLERIGCDYLQGYYFSKPIPAADATALIAATQSQPALRAL